MTAVTKTTQTIKLQWILGLNNELKEGNKRLHRINVELREWCTQHNVNPEHFRLRMTAPYTYECELDENNDITVEFISTWLGTKYQIL